MRNYINCWPWWIETINLGQHNTMLALSIVKVPNVRYTSEEIRESAGMFDLSYGAGFYWQFVIVGRFCNGYHNYFTLHCTISWLTLEWMMVRMGREGVGAEALEHCHLLRRAVIEWRRDFWYDARVKPNKKYYFSHEELCWKKSVSKVVN